MDFWHVLLDVVALLMAAMFLGGLCERFKQSALIGYLLAGLALGPGGFGLVDSAGEVEKVTELGVALLLFSIGLEFSVSRLRSLGAIAIAGGFLQVSLTGLLFFSLASFWGLDARQSIAIGAMMALSSTACVLRLLAERAEMETVRGRTCLAILLFQDVAVVPLVLLIEALGGGGGPSEIALELLKAAGFAAILLAVFYVLFNRVLPVLLKTETFARNRELPILLAIASALGSTWAAHAFHLSPALGAFAAGVLLAESPFATQIRADIGSLKVIFVTLFFVAIGMMAEVAWLARWALVLPFAVAGVICIKATVVWGVARAFKISHKAALAAGLCLSQVGEFSFVLARTAKDAKLLDEPVFELFLLTTFVTLLLTPFLVRNSAPTGRWFQRSLAKWRGVPEPEGANDAGQTSGLRDHAIVVGFGPAGRGVVEALKGTGTAVAVIELGDRGSRLAKQAGAKVILGDATQQEVLEHAHIESACALIVTLPDQEGAREIIQRAKAINPNLLLAARGRYNLYVPQLRDAGAIVVVDEEEEVGRRLAEETLRILGREKDEEAEE